VPHRTAKDGLRMKIRLKEEMGDAVIRSTGARN
jgi:hypothetical protein